MMSNIIGAICFHGSRSVISLVQVVKTGSGNNTTLLGGEARNSVGVMVYLHILCFVPIVLFVVAIIVIGFRIMIVKPFCHFIEQKSIEFFPFFCFIPIVISKIKLCA